MKIQFRLLALPLLLIAATGLLLAAAPGKKSKDETAARAKGKVQTPPPSKPPLEPVDLAARLPGVEQLDLFLLIGQSNMKGRGVMPDEPSRDPRIVMMHMKDDRWYVARHPLHLVGDAQTFSGADNAGVGSGLAFAEAVRSRHPQTRIALIPSAVGGSSIDLWRKGARLYDEAMRRAKLAQQTAAPLGGAIRGVLWLQGEADANDQRIDGYPAKLHRLVDDLRADLGNPNLIFIACTIGEFRGGEADRRKRDMNEILLALPSHRPRTGAVDARDIKTHIGDQVHFDTAAQDEIGRRFAAKYLELAETR